MAARPKSMVPPKVQLGGAASRPLSIHNGHSDNVPDSPTSLLNSSTGGAVPRIKIKASTTPEARSRALVRPKLGAIPTPISFRTKKLGPTGVYEEHGDGGHGNPGYSELLDAMGPSPELTTSDNVMVSIR